VTDAPAAPTEISYSRLRAYLDCPWLFKLLYVDRRRTSLTAPSALGGSLHRALAAYYARDGSTLEQLLDLYEESWLHMGFETPQEQAEYHARGAKILRRYWALEEGRRSRILFVEKEFRFPLGPYVVRGIVDRVDERPDGAIEVIDYKSQQEPQAEEEVRRNRQLQIYGLACRRALGLTPSALTMLYLSKPLAVSVPYEASLEPELESLLTSTAEKMAGGRFEPDTRHCPVCPFRNSCEFSVAKGT
jgi:putative RecB family exonuclease